MTNRPRINCIPGDHCHDLPPPSPPPPLPQLPTPIDRSFSPYLIFMFCGLAVSFCFICYLIFATRYRRYQRNRDNRDETDEDLANDYLGPVIHHPVWLIDTIGLEKSQIESIQVFKYKKDQGLIEGTDCSVCLSEFEDDESLRLLPKCSHAFHVPCIDTWLTSHTNCPMCRAPIFNTTSAQTETIIEVNSIEPSTREETPSDQDSQTVDHHVVDVENNGEVEKTLPISNKTCSGTRAQSDLADHHRVEGDASVATRRSVSMNESLASVVHFAVANYIPHPDQERPLTSQLVVSKKPNSIPKSGHKRKGSSSSFHLYSKAMKSSSFGHSLQKASSFTSKCPLNRSY